MANVSEVTSSLNFILETINTPEYGPWPLMEVTLPFGTSKVTIKCIQHPVFIKQRITKLEGSARKFGSGTTKQYKQFNAAMRFKPSNKVVGRSSKVAQRFLDDNERDNWENYNTLFTL